MKTPTSMPTIDLYYDIYNYNSTFNIEIYTVQYVYHRYIYKTLLFIESYSRVPAKGTVIPALCQ